MSTEMPPQRRDSEVIQILATEHWSLLATRALTYQESLVLRVEKANGKFINKTVKTYENVSQFWTYDEKKFLSQPVYSRDYPPLKS